ncbi:MAG: diguanylate cyclase [Phycisphaeraceae bacterium]|nr:diguanylate cyclase [Phycisphaeraceae bacterium]
MAQESTPHILLIENDPACAEQMTVALREHFGLNQLLTVSTLAEALAVDLTQVDMVLTELDLPDASGLDLLRLVLDCKPDLPVIVVTSQRRMEGALQAIRMGASDYLVKAGDYLFALPVIVQKTLAMWRIKQENVRLQAQLASTLTALRIKNRQLEEAVHRLETMAATDPLTGLANRRSFNQALDRAFAEANRYGQELACVMIDLDGFKQYNDTLGHQKGDEILQRTARVMEANCRRSDVAGRYGGDEFVLLLPQTGMERARMVAQRIADEMAFCSPSGSTCRLTLSIGIATLRHSRPANCDELIAHADQALYRAKAAGKARLMVHHGGAADTPGAPGASDEPTPAVDPKKITP